MGLWTRNGALHITWGVDDTPGLCRRGATREALHETKGAFDKGNSTFHRNGMSASVGKEERRRKGVPGRWLGPCRRGARCGGRCGEGPCCAAAAAAPRCAA
eukprot:3904704-Rhodomonas_salina.1